ncbi:AraC family transcriptional regulator [Chelativorans sp.]|uniref:AraC family transcriptional regulator n=1 Tax=Chelativorans sp. TaxID=2203393 RepID=UPI002811974A|nr:AraC family transcriptional regulator [Chelativorans sp.]
MGLQHFSTADIPAEDAVASVQDTFESIINMFIDTVDDSPLTVHMSVRVLPNAAAASSTFSPLKGTRTPSRIAADGNDDFTLIILNSGRMHFSQAGRHEVVLRPGEAYLWDNDRPGTGTSDRLSSAVNVVVPRNVLSSAVSDLDPLLENGLPATAGLKLLAGYAQTLSRDVGVLSAAEEAIAAAHLYDLTALALGAARDIGAAAGRGLRAARLRAIKDDIIANLADESLSLEVIARRHGISPRYVRALFETEETSFTEFVLNARLARAYRMLTDHRLARHAISTIAFDAGFNDLTYFGRTFRRRYGMTPSDVRAQAIGGRGGA